MKEEIATMEWFWLEREKMVLEHITDENERKLCRAAYSKQRMNLRDAIEQKYGLPGRIQYPVNN